MIFNIITIGVLFVALCISLGVFVFKLAAKSITFLASVLAAIIAVGIFSLICIGLAVVIGFFMIFI